MKADLHFTLYVSALIFYNLISQFKTQDINSKEYVGVLISVD